MSSPPADHLLTISSIRSLLEKQAPQWASLAIVYLSEGWDNCMYRLGDEMLLRLPRRQLGNELMQVEQRWLNQITQGLPIPTPRILLAGQPTMDYPYYWSVTSYLPGQMAISPKLPLSEALRLADFYRQLHQPAPATAPHNPYRGVALAERSPQVEARLDTLHARGLNIDILKTVWRKGLVAKPYDGPARWQHGDGHPKNILIHQGKISAILDWGDLTAGDPATDLAAFWMLFSEARDRRAALVHYGADEDLQQRARAWAALFATVLSELGLKGDKLFAQVAEFTCHNLLTDT